MIIKLKDIKEKEIIKAIKSGKILIYPTDTIYGIGCDATNYSAVRKIREIKNRFDKPLSVIAPSKQWIYDNFEFNNKAYIQKLPGPFTFILQIKNKVVADNVSNGNTLGVRIPGNDFVKIIQKSKLPFITTSVNETGETSMTSIENASSKLLDKVDIVIDAGDLINNPSVIIDLTSQYPKIIERKL